MRLLVVAIALVSLLASPAGAALFEPLWTKKNGNTITATPTVTGVQGDEFELSLYLTPGSEGVSFYSVSISYDDLLLGILHAEEIIPTEFDGSVSLGFTEVASGQISSFDGAMNIGDPGPTGSTRLLIGTAIVRVDAALLAATTLPAGYFAPADGCQNNASGQCSSFGTATIIPEPGTFALLGIGLTLLGASRRPDNFGRKPRRRP